LRYKNGYRGRPTSNSLTGHSKRLILTPSRICGVRWKGQCRKLRLSPPPETAMSFGPLCQMCGMKLLHLRVTFGHLSRCNSQTCENFLWDIRLVVWRKFHLLWNHIFFFMCNVNYSVFLLLISFYRYTHAWRVSWNWERQRSMGVW